MRLNWSWSRFLPLGDCRSASCGDLGGQWTGLTISVIFRQSWFPDVSGIILCLFGDSRTITMIG